MSEELTAKDIVNNRLLQCEPDLALIEAARRMRESNCSSIVVIDGGEPVGIWTERDALKVDFADPGTLEVAVECVMSTPVKTVPGDMPLDQVAMHFKEESVRHYLVKDDGGATLGIVTQTDVILNQGVEHFLYMRDVESALSRALLVIPGDADLNVAALRMRQMGVDAAVVEAVDDEGPGIITERDLVRLIAERDTQGPVSRVASRPLACIPKDSSLLYARDLLEKEGIRHLGVMGEKGDIIGLLSFSDILESVQYEYVHRLEEALQERDTALRRSEKNLHLAHKVIEASLDGVMIVGSHGLIEMVNPAFTMLTGYEPVEVIGKNPNILASGRHDEEFYRDMWHSLTTVGHWQGEIWNRRKNGQVFPEWLSISVIPDEEGGVHRYAAIFSDITERKKAEERIKNLAYFDMLSGLPNRRLFIDRLSMAMATAHRHGHQMAVMFLDLDLFKRINDSLGHNAGDQVLQTVARRLVTSVREGDTVARLGGDEFTILMPEIDSVDDAVRLARRLIEEVKEPFRVEGHELYVTTSLGLAFYPEDGATVESLLKNADTAMYRAKDLGRNSFQMYSATMNARSFERLAMESSLRYALERKEFDLAYQVKVDMGDGRISGVEALIRWRHPELGVVPPSDFIPLAEENGLIEPIGAWVLEEACCQNKRWQDAGLPAVRIAVNVSARQIDQGTLVQMVRKALEVSGLEPRFLEIEVTESALMNRVDKAADLLHELRFMGVHISIDDFGTGYSSFSYLKRMPIDTLKIDRSFVQDMSEDSDDIAIVSSIIAMSQAMDLRVVAEGVENEDQVALLRIQGCDEVQGYLIGRPVSAGDLYSLFDRNLLPGEGGGVN